MLQVVAKLLGLAPDAPKTGAREAALLLFFCVFGLTVFAVLQGTEMVRAMTGILVTLWPSSLTYMGWAFKIKSDQNKSLMPTSTDIPPEDVGDQ